MAVAKISQRHNFVDTAAEGAEHLIHSTQRATNDALESLADSVSGLRAKSSPVVNLARDQSGAYAQRGLEALREARQLLRERALRVSDQTTGYIRDEPVKAILVAVAAGVLATAFLNLIARARRNSD